MGSNVRVPARLAAAMAQKLAKGKRGSRQQTLQKQVLQTQLKRTAVRSKAAILAGRVPGKPGKPRTVVGSTGGPHGARDADAKLAREAKKRGLKPMKAKRIRVKPAASFQQSVPTLRPKPAATGGRLALLEVCAYKVRRVD